MGSGKRGCLAHLAALLGIAGIALVALAGLVVRFGWAETLVGRLAGAALVAASGGALVAASRSYVFADVFSLLNDSPADGPDTAYNQDYRQQTGAYAGPLVVGVILVLAAIVLAILGP